MKLKIKMKRIYQNFVFYHINDMTNAHEIYQFGLQLFSLLQLEIISIGHLSKDHNNELQLKEYSDKNYFEQNILSDDTNFNLNNLNIQDERFSFSNRNTKVDTISFVSIHINLDRFNRQQILDFKTHLEKFTTFSYGISYKTEDLFDAISYITGQSFVSLFSYDDPHIWEEALFNDFLIHQEFNHKIRLVYEDNYITTQFLDNLIDNKKLKDCI